MKKTLILFIYLPMVLLGQTFNGMTLFAPTQGGGSFSSYLVNNEMDVIKSWSHSNGAASMPYLLQDSTLVYPYRVPNPTMSSGGVGGGISKYNWEGDLLWHYEISNNTYQHHHDIEPLPNGNILVIVWERKTDTEAYAVGRQSIDNSLNEMWAEAILEVEPVETNEANIVWEWHIWDHLIQDVDSGLPGFGVISEHPELQDINYGNAGTSQGPGGPTGDWKHLNAINYNSELDQIVISSRHHDEIYIIDHSTTTEEAAGHSGGNSGMGGDYLYRWGNPQAYGRGNNSNHQLASQHGVNWIPQEYPGEGNLILFNNNYTNSTSAVFELVPPLNENGTYDIDDDQPFGPDNPTWFHAGNFHTQMQGGAFRQPNGNTLVTDCDDAFMFEVTNDHEVVWSHDYGNSYTIARAQKYPLNYLDGGFPEFILGDVNFDGILNILDVVSLVNYVLDIIPFLDEQVVISDITQDGDINILDIVTLVNIILAS